MRHFTPAINEPCSVLLPNGTRHNAVLVGYYHGSARVLFTGGKKDSRAGCFGYADPSEIRKPRRVRRIRSFGAVVGKCAVA